MQAEYVFAYYLFFCLLINLYGINIAAIPINEIAMQQGVKIKNPIINSPISKEINSANRKQNIKVVKSKSCG